MSCKTFVLIGALALITIASATVVQKCSSGPQAISVDIKGCDKEPCKLVDGIDAIMDVTFTNPRNSSKLVPKVRATVGIITVTYPLPGELQDGCNSLLNGGSCPLVQAEDTTYRLAMPIAGFPHISVGLEFSLLGDNNEVFQCFKVACKVVAA